MLLSEMALQPVSLESVARAAMQAFKSSPMKKSWTTFRGPEPEQDGMMVEFRDWGNWEVPQGEEDDGDYDWKVPTEETKRAASAIIKSLEAQYPTFNLRLSGSEKNWLDVVITPKV